MYIRFFLEILKSYSSFESKTTNGQVFIKTGAILIANYRVATPTNYSRSRVAGRALKCIRILIRSFPIRIQNILIKI
jgi:hypothetical protein